MYRILYLFFLATISFTTLSAQQEKCYERALRRGEEAYQQGSYALAIQILTDCKGRSEMTETIRKEFTSKAWKASDGNGDGIVNGRDKCRDMIDPCFETYKPCSYCPEMVKISGDTFQMGSDRIPSDENPIHAVKVSDFFIGKYEVTNAEYVVFLNEKGNQTEGGVEWIDLEGNWNDERCRIKQSENTYMVESGFEQYPVIYVSWYGATAYAQWLSAKTGNRFRLPTEAEWEYAAGNGAKHTKYSWGNEDPSGKRSGNIADETIKKKFTNWTILEGYMDGFVYTAPVGSFDPNDLGLHDMSGNVWEWCGDWYSRDYYQTSSLDNPTGPATGKSRVCRGGSWGLGVTASRVAYRFFSGPALRAQTVGFRLVQDYPPGN